MPRRNTQSRGKSGGHSLVKAAAKTLAKPAVKSALKSAAKSAAKFVIEDAAEALFINWTSTGASNRNGNTLRAVQRVVVAPRFVGCAYNPPTRYAPHRQPIISCPEEALSFFNRRGPGSMTSLAKYASLNRSHRGVAATKSSPNSSSSL
jgi:hypothetical protein